MAIPKEKGKETGKITVIPLPWLRGYLCAMPGATLAYARKDSLVVSNIPRFSKVKDDVSVAVTRLAVLPSVPVQVASLTPSWMSIRKFIMQRRTRLLPTAGILKPRPKHPRMGAKMVARMVEEKERKRVNPMPKVKAKVRVKGKTI